MGPENIVEYMRQVTDIETTDLSDEKVENLVKIAWAEVIDRVGKRETLEKVRYMDSYRMNTIDGSNTVFYTRNSYNRYSGDYNNDLALDEDDIEVWLYNRSTRTRTQATVSAYSSNGVITLETAPTGENEMYINYLHLPVPMDPLDYRLRNATAYVTASMAYSKLEPADFDQISFRGLSLKKSRPLNMPGAFDSWSAKAALAINNINSLQCMVRTQDLLREHVLQLRRDYIAAPQYLYQGGMGYGGQGPTTVEKTTEGRNR